MPKDYAKRVFTTRRKPKKREWVKNLLLGFGLLLTIWIAYQSIIHRHDLLDDPKPWFEKVKMLLLNKTISHPNEITLVKNLPQEPMVQFDFYNELPKVPVGDENHLENHSEALQKGVFEKKVTAYTLQFGEFRDEAAAGQMRLSLLLAGIEADLIKIKTNQGLVYKVQQGPYKLLSQAKKLQRQFEKKGINCTLNNV